MGTILEAAHELKLEPWGQITGQVVWGDRPGVDETVSLSVMGDNPYPGLVGASARAKTGGAGTFTFEDVPPAVAQISRLVPDLSGNGTTQYQFPVMHVDVEPGKMTEVLLGGPGRTVTGRLTGLDSYEGLTLRVHPRAPHIGFPGDAEQWAGWTALRNSPAGKIVFRDAEPVGADGAFRIEGLVPESYQLFVNGGARQLIGSKQFRVESGDDSDEPQDLGQIAVKSRPK